MPKHHIIDVSSIMSVNILNILPELAHLRTAFLPARKRCCAPREDGFAFLNATKASANAVADGAYVRSIFTGQQLADAVKSLFGGKKNALECLLQDFRMGKESDFQKISDAILDLLGLEVDDFSTLLPLAGHLINLPNSPSTEDSSQYQTRLAMAYIEQAINAQIVVNQNALENLKAFVDTHPGDKFSFVNVSIPTHVNHIIHLLNAAGISVQAATLPLPEYTEAPQEPASATLTFTPPKYTYFMHSSCMHQSYPQDFLDEQVIGADKQSPVCYYSADPKKIALMHNASLDTSKISARYFSTQLMRNNSLTPQAHAENESTCVIC